MMAVKKMAVRYCLLKKRLLKKPAFLLILLCIPLLTFGFSFFAKTEDAGFLHIAVAAREKDGFSASLMDDIANSSEIVRFTVTDSPKEAKEKVSRGECDAAWIFEKDLREKTEKLSRGESVTLVTAYEGEQSTFNNIAKEKIFAAFYHEISYRLYEIYCKETVKEGEYTEEELLSVYEKNAVDGELIRFEYAKGGEVMAEEESYLLSPLRGLLSAVMLLCSLAATVYFLCDERDGVYTFLRKDKRFFVLLGTNLAALSVCGVFVSAALYFSGDYTFFFRESILLVLYILALSGFSSLLGAAFSDVGTFSIIIPAVTVGSLVLAPVFVDLSKLKALQILIPSYHYLYAAEGIVGWWTLLLYFALSFILGYTVYIFIHRIKKR